MIRLLIFIGIFAGAIYLIRWFLTTPTETVAANIRKSLWLFLGLGLIFLAVTGKLNIIFALVGSAVPLIAKHLPNLLRVFGIVKSIQSAHAKEQTPPAPASQEMNTKNALDILGLQPDASKKDIIEAHKRLMQKIHPDKGGSAHLASQINRAKNTLLDNHDH